MADNVAKRQELEKLLVIIFIPIFRKNGMNFIWRWKAKGKLWKTFRGKRSINLRPHY
jgi:hypothetical protein